MTTMTCDVCDEPGDVALIQPGDTTADGPTALCAEHLTRFSIALLLSRSPELADRFPREFLPE
ncbi:hypothetical protein ACWZHB_00810 [Nocardia sp. FBN12]|uniref:hypothetical protein n=1 Tax=Nocardia sp. FBN12 TaxID=3419766 RepID=UPI003D03DB81